MATLQEHLVAEAELDWYYRELPHIVGARSSWGQLEAIANGLITVGGNYGDRGGEEYKLVAVRRGLPIGAAIGQLLYRQQRVLSLVFDPTHSFKERVQFGRLTALVRHYCNKGKAVEKHAKAEGILQRAVVAYLVVR